MLSSSHSNMSVTYYEAHVAPTQKYVIYILDMENHLAPTQFLVDAGLLDILDDSQKFLDQLSSREFQL